MYETYHAAHDDLAIRGSLSCRSRRTFRRGLDLTSFSHSTNGSSSSAVGSSATSSATGPGRATRLAAGAEDLIEGSVELAGHFDERLSAEV